MHVGIMYIGTHLYICPSLSQLGCAELMHITFSSLSSSSEGCTQPPPQTKPHGHTVVTWAAMHCLVAHEWSHNNKYYRTVMGTDIHTALSR